MRLVIISNRAPVNIIPGEDGNYTYAESAGGLASGLRAYVDRLRETKTDDEDFEILWFGWPGASVENEEKVRREIAEQFGTESIFLSEELMEKFYEGFCNKTIWPLFHYFTSVIEYDQEYWETYNTVNRIFCDALLRVIRPDDIIWVHDYHLMLLPEMIRESVPDATIGFFLHIPFPSFEVFRLMPSQWRKKILEGLFGADLIGFHTHDYRTYFLRCTLRILGLPNNMGEVQYGNRVVKVDSFPMGIDYQKYNEAGQLEEVANEKETFLQHFPGQRIILSIDRQDYSKGILNRLYGYEHFLKNYEDWRQKVMMVMVVIPSRIGVESYQGVKSSIDEHVGRINGKYGTLDWMPILYQYRSLTFEELIALYNLSDVALVTPLRDGMNLIAKEYIACRNEGRGVLILSEMAGAVDELNESIIINPNNVIEISDAILDALEMNEPEQAERIGIMQKRLRDYDVFKWAGNFVDELQSVKMKQQRMIARLLPDGSRKKIISHFRNSTSRILFLDYDGTLRPFTLNPADAVPEAPLLSLITSLCRMEHTEVVLISGRDWQTLEKWFGHLPVNLVGEHGLFLKERGRAWRMLKPVRRSWKSKIKSVMQMYCEKLPGAGIEEKDYSIAFHFRKSDPELASLRVKELMSHLVSYTANMDLRLLKGNKVIEMRSAGIDKGVAAMHWLPRLNDSSRFILAIGDDMTDEDMFRVMPPEAYSIKVGRGSTYAIYNVNNSGEVMELLTELAFETVDGI